MARLVDLGPPLAVVADLAHVPLGGLGAREEEGDAVVDLAAVLVRIGDQRVDGAGLGRSRPKHPDLGEITADTYMTGSSPYLHDQQ